MNVDLTLLWLALPIDALILWFVFRAGYRTGFGRGLRGAIKLGEEIELLEQRVRRLEGPSPTWRAPVASDIRGRDA